MSSLLFSFCLKGKQSLKFANIKGTEKMYSINYINDIKSIASIFSKYNFWVFFSLKCNINNNRISLGLRGGKGKEFNMSAT